MVYSHIVKVFDKADSDGRHSKDNMLKHTVHRGLLG